MLARVLYSYGPVSQSQVGVLSKRLNEPGWGFFVRKFGSTFKANSKNKFPLELCSKLWTWKMSQHIDRRFRRSLLSTLAQER